MEDDRNTKVRSDLRRALERLAQGKGVQDKNLLEALEGELGVLRGCWGINLKKHEEVEPGSNWTSAHYTVLLNLEAHIRKLKTPVRVSRQKYLYVVSVSFNMQKDKGHAALKGMDLGGRRRWLDNDPGARYSVSESTSWRYLNHAISQIEQQIMVSGYVPVKAGLNNSGKASTDDAISPNGQPSPKSPNDDSADEPRVSASAAKIDRPNRWLRRNRKWLVPAAAVAVAAAVVVPLVTDNPSSGAPPRAPSNNAHPVAVSMATGPVHVDSIAYERDGTGKSDGWSYIFPQKLQMSTDDLAALNKLGGNGPAYEDWMLNKGAVNPDDASIQLLLRNKTNSPITITDVQLVKQCREPLTGTLFYEPEQGSPGDTYLTFNLDNQFSIAKDGATGASYFTGQAAHTIQLVPNETSTLLIDATTKQQYCEFHLNLIIDPSDSSSPVRELVDNNGKPFEVTAIPDSGQRPTFSYYQAVYAVDKAPDGLGFGAADPVTYNGG
jgi:hypothetical protein